MTKGDPLKTLATAKKKTDKINKIGDIYIYISIYLCTQRQLWDQMRLKCLYTANNAYWVQNSHELLLHAMACNIGMKDIYIVV